MPVHRLLVVKHVQSPLGTRIVWWVGIHGVRDHMYIYMTGVYFDS